MEWSRLQRKFESSDFFFVYDERSTKRTELASLRSQPALQYLGIEAFTCPKSWRKINQQFGTQFEWSDYDFVELDELNRDHLPSLCAVTNQHYESKLPIFSLSPIVDQYTQSNSKLVIVGDRRTFQLNGRPRPLYEDPIVDDYRPYSEIYEAFSERYAELGYAFPLRDTLNIFIQENAILYNLVTNSKLTTVSELFNSLIEAPYLPLVQGLRSVFTTDTEPGASPIDADVDDFGRWLRRRVELDYHDGRTIAMKLNELPVEHERLFDPSYRRTHVSSGDVRLAVREFETPETPIEYRLYNWLTSGLNHE